MNIEIEYKYRLIVGLRALALFDAVFQIPVLGYEPRAARNSCLPT